MEIMPVLIFKNINDVKLKVAVPAKSISANDAFTRLQQ